MVEKIWCVYSTNESPTYGDPCSNGAFSYGLITAVGKGKTTIQALYTSGSRTFTAKTVVKVRPLPIPQRSIKILSPNSGEWGIGTRQKVVFSYSGLAKTDYLVLQLIDGPTPADLKVINPVVADTVEITVPTFPCREDYCEPNMEPGAYVLRAVVLDRAPCSLCPGPEYIPKKLAEDTSDGRINIVKTPTPSKYKFQANDCVEVTADVNVRAVGEKELPLVIGSVSAGTRGIILQNSPNIFTISEKLYRFWHTEFLDADGGILIEGLVSQGRLKKCSTPQPTPWPTPRPVSISDEEVGVEEDIITQENTGGLASVIDGLASVVDGLLAQVGGVSTEVAEAPVEILSSSESTRVARTHAWDFCPYLSKDLSRQKPNNTDATTYGQVSQLQNFLWNLQWQLTTEERAKWKFPDKQEDFVAGTYGVRTAGVVRAFQNFMGLKPRKGLVPGEQGNVYAATRNAIEQVCWTGLDIATDMKVNSVSLSNNNKNVRASITINDPRNRFPEEIPVEVNLNGIAKTYSVKKAQNRPQQNLQWSLSDFGAIYKEGVFMSIAVTLDPKGALPELMRWNNMKAYIKEGAKPRLAVTSPASGEKLIIGDTNVIRWNNDYHYSGDYVSYLLQGDCLAASLPDVINGNSASCKKIGEIMNPQGGKASIYWNQIFKRNVYNDIEYGYLGYPSVGEYSIGIQRAWWYYGETPSVPQSDLDWAISAPFQMAHKDGSDLAIEALQFFNTGKRNADGEELIEGVLRIRNLSANTSPSYSYSVAVGGVGWNGLDSAPLPPDGETVVTFSGYFKYNPYGYSAYATISSKGDDRNPNNNQQWGGFYVEKPVNGMIRVRRVGQNERLGSAPVGATVSIYYGGKTSPDVSQTPIVKDSKENPLIVRNLQAAIYNVFATNLPEYQEYVGKCESYDTNYDGVGEPCTVTSFEPAFCIDTQCSSEVVVSPSAPTVKIAFKYISQLSAPTVSDSGVINVLASVLDGIDAAISELEGLIGE